MLTCCKGSVSSRDLLLHITSTSAITSPHGWLSPPFGGSHLFWSRPPPRSWPPSLWPPCCCCLMLLAPPLQCVVHQTLQPTPESRLSAGFQPPHHQVKAHCFDISQRISQLPLVTDQQFTSHLSRQQKSRGKLRIRSLFGCVVSRRKFHK